MIAPVTQIKLYGERNTGTHFVQNLLRKNFAQVLLPGAANGREKKDRKRLVKAVDGWLIARIVKDRFDAQANNSRLIPEGFGWKHINPPTEYFKAVPERVAGTLFLILVKHPVFWTVSFLKRPYHSFFRYDGMSFSEFVRHPFVPTGRDNVDAAVYDSVVDLYGAKVDGYRRLVELGVHYELVRYESLIQNIGEFLADLQTRHRLTRLHEGPDIVREAATKNDAETLSDYREKYRLDNVRTVVTPDDYDFIIERFGEERLRWLGYPAT